MMSEGPSTVSSSAAAHSGGASDSSNDQDGALPLDGAAAVAGTHTAGSTSVAAELDLMNRPLPSRKAREAARGGANASARRLGGAWQWTRQAKRAAQFDCSLPVMRFITCLYLAVFFFFGTGVELFPGAARLGSEQVGVRVQVNYFMVPASSVLPRIVASLWPLNVHSRTAYRSSPLWDVNASQAAPLFSPDSLQATLNGDDYPARCVFVEGEREGNNIYGAYGVSTGSFEAAAVTVPVYGRGGKVCAEPPALRSVTFTAPDSQTRTFRPQPRVYLPLLHYHRRLHLYTLYAIHREQRLEQLRDIAFRWGAYASDGNASTSMRGRKLRMRLFETARTQTDFATYVQRTYTRAIRHSDAMSLEALHYLRLFAATVPALAGLWKGDNYCSWQGVHCDTVHVPLYRLLNEAEPAVQQYAMEYFARLDPGEQATAVARFQERLALHAHPDAPPADAAASAAESARRSQRRCRWWRLGACADDARVAHNSGGSITREEAASAARMLDVVRTEWQAEVTAGDPADGAGAGSSDDSVAPATSEELLHAAAALWYLLSPHADAARDQPCRVWTQAAWTQYYRRSQLVRARRHTRVPRKQSLGRVHDVAEDATEEADAVLADVDMVGGWVPPPAVVAPHTHVTGIGRFRDEHDAALNLPRLSAREPMLYYGSIEGALSPSPSTDSAADAAANFPSHLFLEDDYDEARLAAGLNRSHPKALQSLVTRSLMDRSLRAMHDVLHSDYGLPQRVGRGRRSDVDTVPVTVFSLDLRDLGLSGAIPRRSDMTGYGEEIDLWDDVDDEQGRPLKQFTRLHRASEQPMRFSTIGNPGNTPYFPVHLVAAPPFATKSLIFSVLSDSDAKDSVREPTPAVIARLEQALQLEQAQRRWRTEDAEDQTPHVRTGAATVDDANATAAVFKPLYIAGPHAPSYWTKPITIEQALERRATQAGDGLDSATATDAMAQLRLIVRRLERHGARTGHNDLVAYFSYAASIARLPGENAPNDRSATEDARRLARSQALTAWSATLSQRVTRRDSHRHLHAVNSMENIWYYAARSVRVYRSVDDDVLFGDYNPRLVPLLELDVSRNAYMIGRVPPSFFRFPFVRKLELVGTSIFFGIDSKNVQSLSMAFSTYENEGVRRFDHHFASNIGNYYLLSAGKYTCLIDNANPPTPSVLPFRKHGTENANFARFTPQLRYIVDAVMKGSHAEPTAVSSSAPGGSASCPMIDIEDIIINSPCNDDVRPTLRLSPALGEASVSAMWRSWIDLVVTESGLRELFTGKPKLI